MSNTFNLKNAYTVDSIAAIMLQEFKPNYLKYQSNNLNDGLAVFSEVYYEKGWNAYIDGELTPHYRVNYVLRGMKIPAGKHKVVFKFEPKVIQKGSFIALISYGLLMAITFGWFFYDEKKKKKAV